MSSKEMDILTARYKLAERIGEKIQYKELLPTCIFNATMDYLNPTINLIYILYTIVQKNTTLFWNK